MINRNPQQRGQSLFSNAMQWPTQPSCIFVVSRNKLPRNCVAIIVLFVRCNGTLIPSYGFAGIVKLAILSAQEELWSPHNTTIIIARASSSGHKLYLFTVKELLFILLHRRQRRFTNMCDNWFACFIDLGTFLCGRGDGGNNPLLFVIDRLIGAFRCLGHVVC